MIRGSCVGLCLFSNLTLPRDVTVENSCKVVSSSGVKVVLSRSDLNVVSKKS